MAVTLLACLPMGVVAIVYAAQVRERWDRGDLDGARRCSRLARRWIYASFLTSLASAALIIAATLIH